METSKEIEEKGLKIFKEGKVRKDVETDKRIHFVVQGKMEEHSVIFDKVRKNFSCDCRYSTLQKKECSHIVAAKLMV